jgi:Zn-dependent protease/predicted transcriptional regulator
MHASTPLFKIFGFEVKLDFTWFLLALLITWTLSTGVFPEQHKGLSKATYWWMGLASAIGIFFSIVFHELSHSLVARHYKLDIKGITLFIFGGVAEMKSEPKNPKSEFFIAIAGPIMSFFIALVCYLITKAGQAWGWPASITGVTGYMAFLNTLLGVFNLVPAFPLDGGRVLRAILWHWKKSFRKATHLSSRIGAGFGLALIILGVLALIGGNIIGGMWYILIGLFLRGAAIASYQTAAAKEMLEGHPVREFMNPNPVIVSPQISLQELLENYVYRYHFKLYPVVRDGQLLGTISVQEVKTRPATEWSQISVQAVMQDVDPKLVVHPDTDCSELMPKMMQQEFSTTCFVVEHGNLIGVIALKDIWEYMATRMDIENR